MLEENKHHLLKVIGVIIATFLGAFLAFYLAVDLTLNRMFNPEYQIDVLQVLVASCKKKNFSIRWPGTYNDGKLMYAETGYSDFKTFDLDKYDVTCVV